MSVGAERQEESWSGPPRQIHLEEAERALRPDWARSEALFQRLMLWEGPWRTDPVLQCIVLEGSDFADNLLREGLALEDRTEAERHFLSQESGVRIIGWDPFGGILIYGLTKDQFTLYDPYSFTPKADLPIWAAFGMQGLGRETPQRQTDFKTGEEAVASLKPECRRLQWGWIQKARS